MTFRIAELFKIPFFFVVRRQRKSLYHYVIAPTYHSHITIILYQILNDICTPSLKFEAITPLFFLKKRLKISPSKRIFCELYFWFYPNVLRRVNT